MSLIIVVKSERIISRVEINKYYAMKTLWFLQLVIISVIPCDIHAFALNNVDKRVRIIRLLKTKTTQAFVNLATVLTPTECSKPVLEVYLNQDLIYSNASGRAAEKPDSKEVPKEIMKVHINANMSYFTNSQRKKEYYFSPTERSFFDAEQDCSSRAMRLLTIKNSEEQDDIFATMQNQAYENFWTSGNVVADHETWRWSDGEEITYFHWYNGEPNNEQGNEYCLELWKNGYWIDSQCEAELHFICESVEKLLVNLYIGENLVFQNTSSTESDTEDTNTITVHIGVDGNNNTDHSALVLVQRKNSPEDLILIGEDLKYPSNFEPGKFNGIDFRIETIRAKDFSCPKEKVYYFHSYKKKLNYEDALELCHKLSMKLVSIETEEEQMVVEIEMKKRNIDHYYWTSGYLGEDGSWYWSENKPVTYTNWAPKEPNNKQGTEKCIELYFPLYRMRWNDQECEDRNPVICESLD